MAAQRIVTRATELLGPHCTHVQAIERACSEVATTPATRQFARRVFMNACARAFTRMGAWR